MFSPRFSLRVPVIVGSVTLAVLSGCSTMKKEPAPSSPIVLPTPPRVEELPDETRQSSRKPRRDVQIGEASWYGPGFDGELTASGEVYDQHDFTAAHPTLPAGSKVKVTNPENGKSVEVQINDRGPFANGRIIDLSRAAAKALGMVKSGTTTVHLEVLSRPDESKKNGRTAAKK